MTSEPRPLDLLVIGGMTIDHLADGTSAAGGSAIHIARAAAPRGVRVGVVTASGSEAEAQAGLAELHGLAALVENRSHEHSAAFRHREGPDGRRLSLDHLGGPVELDATASDRIFTRAVLYAPVADEIPLDALALWADRERAAILQGWLRSTDEGAEVRPLALSALRPELVAALSQLDLLVASCEDLLGEADAPDDQLAALRHVFGAGPTLVVTDEADGMWLDMALVGSYPGLRRHLAVPWRVQGASTVGAGDILAAFLALLPRDTPRSNDQWAEDAMRVVAEVLEERASHRSREDED
jgi:sugar/nucleoside kinase (ribokinase family)